MATTNLQALIDLMATLRDKEKGCPWDLQQSQQTLVSMTFEEMSELADAIARGDSQNICEELGDILFHLVFYARIAEENGDFTMQAVIDTVAEKMIRRHPHIFEGKVYADAAEQKADWARIKAEEKTGKSIPYPILDDKQRLDSLPAILQSIAMQRNLATMGFDWHDANAVFAKVIEEMHEVKVEIALPDNQDKIVEEYGDLLFAVLNLGRKLHLDAEMALRQANHKFYARSEAMIKQAGSAEKFADLSMAEKEALWIKVKQTSTDG
ncbi:MAG: nucleoside triphosphate pyrophosphohydrolase [Gammaproteobacteria bacterium]|nr:MAG: nucleoside triphosphate pyrophosphohydrolase [Gammaproteobacteria bacterium]